MNRISGLSDELLVKILLLVPMKVAVSTSLLSKRWEFIWMWLPKLKYGARYNERKRLGCFLNKTFPLHRAPVLESLSLNLLGLEFKPEDIKLWVGLSVSRCIRELEIMYASYPDKPNILPSNLYICKSLVILKLHGVILLDVPRMAFLPSLKTLKLGGVRCFNEDSLQRFLSKCPILEDLTVDLREGGTTRKLSVIVPSLQRLSIYISHRHDIDGIVIETPSLKYFKLKDDSEKTHYYSIENMPNLIEAFVDVYSPEVKMSFLGSMTSVKRLEICSQVVYDEGFVFIQLEHLKLCRCKKDSSNLLAKLLKDSCNLQVLDILINGEHDFVDLEFYWNEPNTVPKCILSSLQTLEMTAYDGEVEEKDFVVYILKNARHLKTARITSREECELPKLQMIKELALSSRASTTCQLIFD